jgi:hypothetical protein
MKEGSMEMSAGLVIPLGIPLYPIAVAATLALRRGCIPVTHRLSLLAMCISTWFIVNFALCERAYQCMD